MKTKRLSKLLPAFVLVAVAASGCDSTTSLAEVSLVGTWDGVGDLQTTEEARGLTVYIQSDADGVISGTWNTDAIGARSISGGRIEGEQIQFTLSGFPGSDPTFVGGLEQQHRMEGSMAEIAIDGPAVLLRRSVDPPNL